MDDDEIKEAFKQIYRDSLALLTELHSLDLDLQTPEGEFLLGLWRAHDRYGVGLCRKNYPFKRSSEIALPEKIVNDE